MVPRRGRPENSKARRRLALSPARRLPALQCGRHKQSTFGYHLDCRSAAKRRTVQLDMGCRLRRADNDCGCGFSAHLEFMGNVVTGVEVRVRMVGDLAFLGQTL